MWTSTNVLYKLGFFTQYYEGDTTLGNTGTAKRVKNWEITRKLLKYVLNRSEIAINLYFLLGEIDATNKY